MMMVTVVGVEYLGDVQFDCVEQIHAVVQGEPEQHVHSVPFHHFHGVGADGHVENSVAVGWLIGKVVKEKKEKVRGESEGEG